MLALILLFTFALRVQSECANGCNGHGRCTSYDMCICNRNWQANDCSERVCMYGLAHVDTPKGDLDMSGALTGPDHPVVDNSFNYPYGTTESFPQMEDTDLNVLTNSAHYYMECSNKGTCDRTSGECQCFDGYDGVACQRASCPSDKNGVCSGHGVCVSAAQLAYSDYENPYTLWDKDTTMGCKCDAGYFGPSCSQKQCKSGVDPLYLDDSATVKYSTYDFATLTTAPASADTETTSSYHTDEGVLLNDGTAIGGRGLWAIRFFDGLGEDWVTTPIQAGATCGQVQSALENLPNNVIPAGSTYCTRSWNVGRTDNEWTTTGGLGNGLTGSPLYDSQHPATSAHPYKITYRMSIWDAYASSNSYENVGEGGLYTPLTSLAPSFSNKKPVSSFSRSDGTNWFTADNAKFEEGMLLRRVTTAGALSTLGVVSKVNVAASSTSETYTVTYTGSTVDLTSGATGAVDVVVGQYPTLTAAAYQGGDVSSTTIVTTTPGFKAGMLMSITHPAVMTTGKCAIAATALTVYSAAGIVVGMTVTGPGIASGTTVSALVGANGVTLSAAATAPILYSSGTIQFSSAAGAVTSGAIAISSVTQGTSTGAVTTTTGTTTTGASASADKTLTNVFAVSSVIVGSAVSGTGVPSGAYVTAVDPVAGSVTISIAATASATVTLTFTAPNQPTVTTYTITLASGVKVTQGDKLVGYDNTYSVTGIAADDAASADTSLTVAGDLGWSNGMLVAVSGGNAIVTAVANSGTFSLATSAAFVTGATTITVTDGTGLAVGMVVSGPGITSGQQVLTISTNDLVLSAPTDAGAASGKTYTFSNVATLTVAAVGATVVAGASVNGAQYYGTIASASQTRVGLAGNNAVSLTTAYATTSSSVYQSDFCGPVSAPSLIAFSSTITTARVIKTATSNGAVGTAGGSFVVTASGLIDANTLTVSVGADSLTPAYGITVGMVATSALTIGAATNIVTAVNGNVVTLSKTHTAAVSGSITFTSSTTVASTSLIIATAEAGGFVTGMTVQGAGIPEGTTITCGVNGHNAVLSATTTAATYFPVAGTAAICTLSNAAIVVSGTRLTGVLPLSQFTLTKSATSASVTISGVKGAKVVSGLYFQYAAASTTTSMVNGNFLWCAVPIAIGGTGTCQIYVAATPAVVAAGATYTAALSSVVLHGSTLLTTAAAQTAPCLVTFDGAATTMSAVSAVTYFYPIFSGYGVRNTAIATAASSTNVVAVATAGYAPGMTFTCVTATGGTTPCFPNGGVKTIQSVYNDGTNYKITFSGPVQTFATSMFVSGTYAVAGQEAPTRASLTGYIYRIKFYGNPGKLRQPEIVTHLDGRMNSLMSVNYANQAPGTNKDYRVITKVWTDGQQGEENDYFADHCDGVQVTIGNKWVSTIDGVVTVTTDAGADANKNTQAKFFLNSLTTAEKALLKKCLGDSDFDTTNNKDVYNWDWGYDETYDHPIRYPHLIKLVRSVTTYTDGGYYAAVYFSETDNLDSLGSGGTFYLLNPFSPPDAMATDAYEVYTTKGVLALTSPTIAASFGFASKTIYTVDPREDPARNWALASDCSGTGKVASGSASVTTVTFLGSCVPTVGQFVSGPGIKANTQVVSVSGSSPTATVVLSLAAQTGDGATVTALYFTSAYNGDLSCEFGLSDTEKDNFWETININTLTTTSTIKACLNKTDIITLINPDFPAVNPPHLNLYTVTRMHKDQPSWSNTAIWGPKAVSTLGSSSPTYYGIHYQMGATADYMTNTINVDIATNWGAGVGSSMNGKFSYNPAEVGGVVEQSSFRVYKFFPAAASTYNYVAPCSNRGLCDTDTGVCACFPGYTSDNCHEQSSLAL